jgi:hypothetical protein
LLRLCKFACGDRVQSFQPSDSNAISAALSTAARVEKKAGKSSTMKRSGKRCVFGAIHHITMQQHSNGPWTLVWNPPSAQTVSIACEFDILHRGSECCRRKEKRRTRRSDGSERDDNKQ